MRLLRLSRSTHVAGAAEHGDVQPADEEGAESSHQTGTEATGRDAAADRRQCA